MLQMLGLMRLLEGHQRSKVVAEQTCVILSVACSLMQSKLLFSASQAKCLTCQETSPDSCTGQLRT